jgi:AraC-like DNA-binding protein
VESIAAEIVHSTSACRISRVVVERDPMLGALVTAGPYRQTRFIEQGALVAGHPERLEVLGPGHALEIAPGARFLYLPLSAKGPLVEWVLAIEPHAEPADVPEVRRITPLSEPIPIPLCPPKHSGMYPNWAVPWIGMPVDVGTWASALDIRGTSLAQRLARLVNESPKRVLSAARATVAFELAAHYRGEGTALALDTGYASQSHLSRDLRDRFGIPLTRLFEDGPVRELEWLRLVKSVVR